MDRKKILYVLLFLYFLIAIGNVGYNTIKTYSEIREWYFLTDTQKRYKLFGDLYTFFIFLDKNTPPKASLLIVSKDVRTFYLGRYYLYPKKITVVSLPKDIKMQASPQYIASFGSPVKLQNYSLIKTCGMKEQKGYLYRKRLILDKPE